MMEKILGESPYKSPTDMGVNMAGYAISDDEACREASKHEIVRRYFKAREEFRRSGGNEVEVERLARLMTRVGVTENYSPAHLAALKKAEESGSPAGAIVLPDGKVMTGKTSTLLGAASSVLLNAIKYQAGIDDHEYVISDEALKPICRLRTERLGHTNPHLHPGEMLIALSTTSQTSPLAARVLEHMGELKGCDAYFSVILSEEDERLYKSLGINVCCEPKYEIHRFYHD